MDGIGPRAVFEEQVRPLLDALYRTALRMTGHGASAEDLVQETVLRAWKSYGQFEKGTNFKAWLFTILTHAFINEYRRRSRAPGLTDFTEIEPESRTESVHLAADDLQRLGDQLGDEALRALERVPAEFRIVFLLSTFEDLTYKEIAAVLGVPIGTVMSRLFRARTLLREELAAGARRESTT